MQDHATQRDRARTGTLGAVRPLLPHASAASSGIAPGGDRPRNARISLGSVTRRPPAVEMRPGLEIAPGYRLTEKVGDGPSAEVWKAEDAAGSPVAFKVFRSGVARLPEQGNSPLPAWVRTFRHTHLRANFGEWRVGDRLVLGMEWAEESLRARLERAHGDGLPGLPVGEVLGFLAAAAAGIDALGDAGCPGHGDLKPENLLLVGGRLKVAEAGIGELLATLTQERPSRWSDQSALASIYCEMLGGRPRGGDDLGMIPPEQRPAVARALSEPPESRWPSCQSFVEALSQPLSVTEESRPSWGGWGTRAAALAAVSAAIAVLLFRPFPPPTLTAQFVPDVGSSAPVPERTKWVPVPPQRSHSRLQPTPQEIALSEVVTPKRVVPRPPTSLDLVLPLPLLPPYVLDLQVQAPLTEDTPPRKAANPRAPSTPQAQASGGDDDLPSALAGSNPDPKAPEPIRRVPIDLVERASRVAPPPPPPAESEVTPHATTTPIAVKSATPPTAAPAPGTAVIVVLMPDARWDLSIRGQVGPSTLEEWSGPRRVIHTPRLAGKTEYTIGAFWGGSTRKVVTRTSTIAVSPGETHEIDLRRVTPKSRTITR